MIFFKNMTCYIIKMRGNFAAKPDNLENKKKNATE